MEVIKINQQQTLLTGSVEMYGTNAGSDAMAPEQEWYDSQF